MDNFDVLKDVYESSLQSQGSAQQELEKYLDSINGKVNEFKNRLQELASVTIDSDWIKIIVDLGTSAIKVVTSLSKSFGGLNLAIGAVAAIFLQKNGLGLASFDRSTGQWSSGITKIVSGLKNTLVKAFTKTSFGNDVLESLFSGKSMSTNITDILLQNKDADLPSYFVKWYNGLDDVQKKTVTLGDALQTVGQKTFDISNAFNTLKSVGTAVFSTLGTMALTMVASWAITKGIEALTNYIRREEIAIQKGKEAMQTISDINSEYEKQDTYVSKNLDRYNKLRQGVVVGDKNGIQNKSLSTDEFEEFLSLNKEMASLFPSLVAGYDTQGNAMLDLSSDANTATEAMKNLLDKERRMAEFKVGEQLSTAVDGTLTSMKQLYEQIDDYKESLATMESIKEQVGNGTEDELLNGIDLGLYNNAGAFSYTFDGMDEAASKIAYKLRDAYQKAWLEAGINTTASDGIPIEYFDIDLGKEVRETTLSVGIDQEYTEEQFEIFKDKFTQLLSEFQEKELPEDHLEIKLKLDESLAEVKATWNQIVPSLISQMTLYDDYQKLGDSTLGQQIQQIISDDISHMNIDSLSIDQQKDFVKNPRAFLRKMYLSPIIDAIKDDKGNFSEEIMQNILDTVNAKDVSRTEWIKNIQDMVYKLFPDNYEKRVQLALALDVAVVDEKGNLIFNNDDVVDLMELSGFSESQINSMEKQDIEFALNMYTYGQMKFRGSIFEEFEEYVKKAREASKTLANLSPEGTIADIFNDENYKESASTYVENIKSLIAAQNELKENGGEISAETYASLTETFKKTIATPEDVSKQLSSSLSEYIKYMRDFIESADLSPDQENAWEIYIKQMIESFGEFEAYLSKSDIKSMMIEALSPDYDLVSETQVNEYIDDIMSQFGDNPNLQIVASMIADGSAFELTGDALYAEYNDRVMKWHIDVEIPNRIEMLNSAQELADAEKSAIEASGGTVGLAWYQNNAKRKKEIADLAKEDADEFLKANRDADAGGDESVTRAYNEKLATWRNAQADEYAAEKEAENAPYTNRIDAYERKIKSLENEATALQNSIKKTEDMGELVDPELYSGLISNAESQITLKQNELNLLTAQAANADPNTDDYNELIENINSTQEAIDNLQNSVDEWTNSPYEQVMTELGNRFEDLQTEASELQDMMSFNEASGFKAQVKDYEDLIANSEKQIKNLEEQNKVLELQAKLNTKNKNKYREIQKQLQTNKSTIRSIRTSQLEWNNTLANLPVNNVKNLSSAIQTALSEIDSATGLTRESIEELKKQFSDINTDNFDDLFYRTENGVKADVVQMERMTEAQARQDFADYTTRIEEQRKAIADYQKQINEGRGTQSVLDGMNQKLQELLRSQGQYFAQYQEMMKQYSDYQAIQRAKSTANAGDEYVSMQGDVESLKEMWDKGLVGTDDFKTQAAYYNAYGFAGADSFEKDYAKIQRYMTEDITGIENFLTDLEAKGYASLVTLSNGTKEWEFNLGDAKSAALDMGMGFEWFMSMVGRLEDYDFLNGIVTSFEQGTMKVEGLAHELAAAKIELAELTARGANADVIEEATLKVAELEKKYMDSQDALDNYNENAGKNLIKNAEMVIKMLDDIKKAYDEAEGDTALQSQLSTQMQNLAAEYGITLTADLEIDPAQKEKIQNTLISWDNPLTASVVGIDESDSEMVESFNNTFDKLKDMSKNGTDQIKKHFETLSNATREDLENIQFHNRAYEGSKEFEDALEAIADEAGISTDRIHELIAALEAGGVLKTDESEAALEELKKSLMDARDKVYELQEDGTVHLNFDVNEDVTGKSIGQLESEIAEIEQEKHEIAFDPELDPEAKNEAWHALDELQQERQTQLTILTALEAANGDVDYLLNLIETGTPEEIQTVFGATDDGTIAQIKETLEAMAEGKEVPITVQLSEEQFAALTSDTRTVNVNANVDNANSTLQEMYTDMLKPHDVTVTGVSVGKVGDKVDSIISTLGTEHDLNVTAELTDNLTDAIHTLISNTQTDDTTITVPINGEDNVTDAVDMVVSGVKTSGKAITIPINGENNLGTDTTAAVQNANQNAGDVSVGIKGNDQLTDKTNQVIFKAKEYAANGVGVTIKANPENLDETIEKVESFTGESHDTVVTVGTKDGMTNVGVLTGAIQTLVKGEHNTSVNVGTTGDSELQNLQGQLSNITDNSPYIATVDAQVPGDSTQNVEALGKAIKDIPKEKSATVSGKITEDSSSVESITELSTAITNFDESDKESSVAVTSTGSAEDVTELTESVNGFPSINKLASLKAELSGSSAEEITASANAIGTLAENLSTLEEVANQLGEIDVSTGGYVNITDENGDAWQYNPAASELIQYLGKQDSSTTFTVETQAVGSIFDQLKDAKEQLFTDTSTVEFEVEITNTEEAIEQVQEDIIDDDTSIEVTGEISGLELADEAEADAQEAAENMDLTGQLGLVTDEADINNLKSDIAQFGFTAPVTMVQQGSMPDMSNLQGGTATITVGTNDTAYEMMREKIGKEVIMAPIQPEVTGVTEWYEQRKAELESDPISITGDTEPYKESVDEAVEYTEGQEPEMQIRANGSPAKQTADKTSVYAQSKKPVMSISADSSNAQQTTNTLLSNINSSKAKITVDIDANTSLFDRVIANIRGTIASIQASFQTAFSTFGFGGKAAGTMTSIAPAHAEGTFPYNVINYKPAYKDGKVALDHDEEALVNELGQESIIRGGIWQLLPPGMHVEKLKKNDVVLNAKQTSDLLRLGRAFGEGKAFAQGTIPGGITVMPSHADPLGKVTGAFKGGQKYTKYGLGTANDKAAKYAQKANTDATNQNTEAQEEQAETIDWIEKLIERTGQKVERITSQITDYVTDIFKKNKLTQQLSGLAEQIKVAEDAVREYSNYLDNFTISDNAELDAAYKNKIWNGELNIEEISDEQIKENISRYEEFYSKLLEAQSSLQEFRTTMLDVNNTLAQMPIESAAEAVDKLSAAYDKLSARSSMTKSQISALNQVLTVDAKNLSAAAGATTKADLKTVTSRAKGTDYAFSNAYAKEALTNLRAQNKEYRNALNEATKNNTAAQNELTQSIKALSSAGVNTTLANAKQMYDLDKMSGLTEAQKTAIQNYNQALQKANIYTNALTDATNNLKDSELSVAQAIVETGQAYLSNVQQFYDAQQKYIESREGRYSAFRDLEETAGISNRASEFNKELALMQERDTAIQKQASELQKWLTQAVKEGLIKKYSEEWYDAMSNINDCKESSIQLKNSQLELYKTMMQLPIEEAAKNIEKLSKAFDTLSTKAGMGGAGSLLNAYARVVRVDLDNIKNDGSALYKELTKLSNELESSKNSPSYLYANEYLAEQINNLRNQNTEYRKAEQTANKNNTTAQKNLQSAIAALKKNKVDLTNANKGILYDTDTMTKLTDKQRNAVNAYNLALGQSNAATEALSEASENARKSQIELAEAMVKAAQDSMSNISAYYDALQGYYEAVKTSADSLVSRKETRGQNVYQNDYATQAEMLEKNIEAARTEVEELEKTLSDNLKSGNLHKNTEEWYEALTKIEQCRNEVRELTNEQIELNQTIAEVPIVNIQKIIDRLGTVRDNLESVVSLLDAAGKYVEKGQILDLYSNAYSSYEQETKAAKIAEQYYNAALSSPDGMYMGKVAALWEEEMLTHLTNANQYLSTAYQKQKEADELERTILNDQLGNIKSMLDVLSSGQSLKEAEGYYLDIKDYQAEMLATQEEIAKQEQINAQTQMLYDKAVAEGREKDAVAYYDELASGQSAINQMNASLEQLSDKIRDDFVESVKRVISAIGDMRSVLESQIDIKNSRGQSLTAQNITDQMDLNTRAYDEQMRIMADRYAAANDALVAGHQAEYDDLISQARQAEAAANGLISTNEQLQKTLQEMFRDAIQRELDALDSAASVLKSQADLVQAQSEDISKDQYQEQIENLRERVLRNQSLARENMRLYNLEMSRGNDLAAAEYLKAARAAEAETNNLRAEMEQLGDEMRTTWITKPIDEYLKKLEQLRKSFSTIGDIINDEMLYDSGHLTDFGVTNLAISVKEYESETESLEQLLKKRQAYIDAYNNGLDQYYSRKEFDEDMQAVTEEIQDMLTQATNARQTIVDIITRTAKEEVDALSDVINKRKELLQAEKDFYSYDRSLKDKTNDIAILEKQKAALEDLTDAESRMRLQKVNKQLKESRQDLEDMIRDHSIELQIAGLDDLQESMNNAVDEYTKHLNSNLESITSAVSGATNTVVNSLSTVEQTIAHLLNSYGVAGLTAESIGYTHQYASGTFRHPGGPARFNENGEELILLPDGSVLMPQMPKNSAVLTAEMTRQFMEFSKSGINAVSAHTPLQSMAVPVVNRGTNVQVGDINNSYIINDATDPQAVMDIIASNMRTVAKGVGEEITKNVSKIGMKKSWS